MAKDSAFSSSGSNKTALIVTIVLAVVAAGLLAWFLYIILRPCNSSSCGNCTGKSKTSGKSNETIDNETDNDSSDIAGSSLNEEDIPDDSDDASITTDTELEEDADENEVGESDLAGASSTETETLPVSKIGPSSENPSHAKAVAALETAKSFNNEDNSGASSNDDALEDIITGESSGKTNIEALNRVSSSRAVKAAAPTSVGTGILSSQLTVDDPNGMVAQVPMTDADEVRAAAAFDPNGRMPASYFESGAQTSERTAKEAKLRALAAKYPERAGELLQNVTGAFHPTQDQVKRMRQAQGNMRPQLLHVASSDASKGIYAALRPPRALSKSTGLEMPFNQPLTYLAAQARANL